MKREVLKILSHTLDKPLENVLLGDQHLMDDMAMTPIEILEFFVVLSEVFDLQIKAQDGEKLKKLSDIYTYINDHAPKQRIDRCAETFSNMKFLKIFGAIAYKLDILSPEMIPFLENFIGFKIRQGLDFTGVKISTLYLMQHLADGCHANCAYCVQSNESTAARKKSTLVEYKLLKSPVEMVGRSIHLAEKKGLERICIQTVYNKHTADNLLDLVKALRSMSDIPITACCIPISESSMKALKSAGLDMIFLNYETATPELFNEIRGKKRKSPYRWNKITEAIDHALEIFGDHKVGSHLQIGLGESQKEALSLIQKMMDQKALTSLLAFRPLSGTAMENYQRSSHVNFHLIQLGSYLIQNKLRRIEDMTFDAAGDVCSFGIHGDELLGIIRSGAPFKNRGGCPGCNRIYYETSPGERLYSFPRDPEPDELDVIEKEIVAAIDLVPESNLTVRCG
jgi:biotin synthase